MAIGTAEAVTALRRDGDETSDHELVERTRSGDDRAFERLYARYHRRIASYVHGMVKDHQRAEDLTQDVFMSALRRMRDTDRPIAFKPWVYEIAKNACIDQFRRSRRAEEVSYDADGTLGSADYGKLVTSEATPETAVEFKQQLDHLCGAFGGLSPAHHDILVMRELEGLSYREIGERLGMTRPAVESTLFRARRRLTEEYEELVSGERCRRVQNIIATAGEGSLGTRDRRRLARHVSYCQPCLRHARAAGVDPRDLVKVPLRRKIAALLPLPSFLKRRSDGGGDDGGVAGGHLHALHTVSVHAANVDPGTVTGWAKAAATAATIALAGVGAGVATSERPAGATGSGPATVVAQLARGGDGLERSAAPVSADDVGSAIRSPASASAGAATPAAAGGRDEQRPWSGASPGDTPAGGAATRERATGPREAGGSRGADGAGSRPASADGGLTPATSSLVSGGASPRDRATAATDPATRRVGDVVRDAVSTVRTRLGGATDGAGSGSSPASAAPALPLSEPPAGAGRTAPGGTDAVGDVVDRAGDAVGQTGGAVGDAVDDTADAVHGDVGGG